LRAVGAHLRMKVISFRFSTSRFRRTIVERAGVHRVNVPCLTDGLCEREGGVALAAPQMVVVVKKQSASPCHTVRLCIQ
jgi:hypothetical protein